MHLVVDEYGAYVKKKSNRFSVTSESKTEEYSADKVSQILFVKGTAITTDAIDLAMEKEIDIFISIELAGLLLEYIPAN